VPPMTQGGPGAPEPMGCDEFGNGCGCPDCMAEHAAKAKLNAEWREALGDDLWGRLVVAPTGTTRGRDE
jgi:hypothetical protein